MIGKSGTATILDNSNSRENSLRMGIRIQERDRDVFVMVNYDFEYITEEGKEVWMKEGEVLLLLSKTNGDWWQVCNNLLSFLPEMI